MILFLKKYLPRFLISGLTFALIFVVIDYTQKIDFNIFKFLFSIFLFGIIGTLVYYITVVLPAKKAIVKK